MCLAIYKPKGVEIPKKNLKRGFEENDHGCGFAYAIHGRIEIAKGFKSFGEFWDSVKPLQPRYPMLIHFRLATHGDRTPANMHPFSVCKGKFAVIHNGIINIKTEGNKSDTATFCSQVLEPMYRKHYMDDSGLKYLIETSIGSGNKIAVLRCDGRHMIYNESSGHWHKGAWYSNDSYKETSRKWSNWLSGTRQNMATSFKQSYWGKLAGVRSDVHDEDELAAEAIAQAEADKQARMPFPDYDKSNHQKMIEG